MSFIKSSLKKADIVLFAVLLAIGLGSMFFLAPKKDGEGVRISCGGKVVRQYSLQDEGEYRIDTENGYNIVVIKNGSVHVSESDCKGHDCMGFGAISKTGSVILCLPHKLSVEITGGGDIDGVSY